MKQVFFDESGNTGQNLVDEADPVFVLASCSFDSNQQQETVSCFHRFKGAEVKFSRLRKTSSGRKAVLAFLQSAAVTAKTAAAVVFHKPYMVVSKYCDVVLEPSMHAAGINFYERGANIATANLLYTTMPVFLNPKTWSDFLSLFVRLIRERSPQLFNEWRTSAELIMSYLGETHHDSAAFIAPVCLLCGSDELFESIGADELDPLIPAYHVLADHWGKVLSAGYEIVADESKVLARARSRLLLLSDPNLKPVTAGYDRRKMEFPLKVADIIPVNSAANVQVQLADVICGAIASSGKALTRGAPLEAFDKDVFDLCNSKKIVINALWPSAKVDPSELGTDTQPRLDEVDLTDYTMKILKGDPATKRHL